MSVDEERQEPNEDMFSIEPMGNCSPLDELAIMPMSNVGDQQPAIPQPQLPPPPPPPAPPGPSGGHRPFSAHRGGWRALLPDRYGPVGPLSSLWWEGSLPFASLPGDIQVDILSRCHPKDVSALGRVSKGMARLLGSSKLAEYWRAEVLHQCGTENMPLRKRRMARQSER